MEDEQKIKKVWDLPDEPIHQEMTAGTVVKPDNIKPGSLMMVVCSSAVRLEMTAMGPKVSRIDNDPSFGGIMSVRAYCYPFIACMVLTGKWKGTRMALDVRRHKLVVVTKHFARSMMEPREVVELDRRKGLLKKKKKNKPFGPHGPTLEEIFGAAPAPNTQVSPPGFMASPPPGSQDPEQHLKEMLMGGGWNVVQQQPDDAQGDPPEYPDDFPAPDDFNDVNEGELDDEEGATL